ncbi:hypothetical protein E2C01_057610 [Portunus trituberculatus]|uniref:Uncharacterized protein n=1 Tax=Portunus trituberculatus TaxID=210409 RepID=A0A5B7GXG3_PORTR|nr:hypothetical protein [Portunus trituberculatus]
MNIASVFILQLGREVSHKRGIIFKTVLFGFCYCGRTKGQHRSACNSRTPSSKDERQQIHPPMRIVAATANHSVLQGELRRRNSSNSSSVSLSRGICTHLLELYK